MSNIATLLPTSVALSSDAAVSSANTYRIDDLSDIKLDFR